MIFQLICSLQQRLGCYSIKLWIQDDVSIEKRVLYLVHIFYPCMHLHWLIMLRSIDRIWELSWFFQQCLVQFPGCSCLRHYTELPQEDGEERRIFAWLTPRADTDYGGSSWLGAGCGLRLLRFDWGTWPSTKGECINLCFSHNKPSIHWLNSLLGVSDMENSKPNIESIWVA